MTDNHLISTSATRLGLSAGLPGREIVHETEMQHGEPDPVTYAHNAGEVVQTSSNAETGTSPEGGTGAEDRSNAPLP